MPTFDISGTISYGALWSVEADTLDEAMTRILEKGLAPIKTYPAELERSTLCELED